MLVGNTEWIQPVYLTILAHLELILKKTLTFSSKKHVCDRPISWGLMRKNSRQFKVKSLVLSTAYCQFVVVIIVNILGWGTKVTQRKRWAVKNDSIKPIPLLSDLHCTISKLHSSFFCKTTLTRGGHLWQSQCPQNNSFFQEDPSSSDNVSSFWWYLQSP